MSSIAVTTMPRPMALLARSHGPSRSEPTVYTFNYGTRKAVRPFTEGTKMSTRLHLSVLAAVAVLGASVPAFAQDVPADANKALWCSAAFGLVSPQARAQGQAAAADNFDKYSKTLPDSATASLKKAGFADDKIKAQGAAYSDKVSKELTGGGGTAQFSVVD